MMIQKGGLRSIQNILLRLVLLNCHFIVFHLVQVWGQNYYGGLVIKYQSKNIEKKLWISQCGLNHLLQNIQQDLGKQVVEFNNVYLIMAYSL